MTSRKRSESKLGNKTYSDIICCREFYYWCELTYFEVVLLDGIIPYFKT